MIAKLSLVNSLLHLLIAPCQAACCFREREVSLGRRFQICLHEGICVQGTDVLLSFFSNASICHSLHHLQSVAVCSIVFKASIEVSSPAVAFLLWDFLVWQINVNQSITGIKGFYYVTRHIDYGHVQGDIYASVAEASAKFDELNGGSKAAAVWE